MSDILASLSSGAVTLISFVLILGLLVFVHELGHFAVAKWAGIRVDEFGFGFPPRAITLFRRGETEYTINWLPLGGFVRMQGENGEDDDDPRSFASKSKLWRVGVLAAGSFMNLILPVLLFALMALAVGVPEGRATGRIEVVDVVADSPASQATPLAAGVEPGLRAGDEILAVSGQRFNVAQMQGHLQKFEEQDVVLTIERGDETLEFTVQPSRFDGEIPRIGVQIADQRELVRYNPLQALLFGFRQTRALVVAVVGGFGELFGGLFAGTSEAVPVAGPIGIMQVTGEVAQTGRIEYILSFMSLLSVNLAIFNLLPIPGLDGGRLFFVLIEALRGQRISAEREGLVHLLGIMLLLGLMVFVSVIDVQRLLEGVSVLQ